MKLNFKNIAIAAAVAFLASRYLANRISGKV